MLEEIVVPCFGRRLEREVMPALRAALFQRELEPLGALVRAVKVDDPALKDAVDMDYQEVRNDILHGQIDYKGEGPLPEHWKQYIDKETNYYDWRHPKWAQDAEKLLVDIVVRAAAKEGWDGELTPSGKTGAGLVEFLLEVGEKLPEAAPLTGKFLEGMPEWLQHDNAYTGGYLTEEEVARLGELLAGRREALERDLKSAALLPAWLDVLARAKAQGVGLTWTVPMLRA